MANEKDKKEAAAKPEKAEVPPEEAAAKAKKRKLIILIAGSAVLLGAISAGLLLFPFGGGDKMSAKAPTTGHDAPANPADGHGEPAAGGDKAKPEAATAGGHEAPKDAAKADAKAAGGKAEETKVAKLEGVDFGCTYGLKPFHVNLGNPLENRYLRLEIAVEYGCAEEIKAEIEKRLPQLRDAVITVSSRKTREFLLGPDGKEQLRKEIQTQINYHMTKKVDDIFITDILIE